MENKVKLTFYGNMEWFNTEEALTAPAPDFLKAARALWDKDSIKNQQEIISLLQPYLKAYFVPAAICDSEELFPNQDDIEANKVKIDKIRYVGKSIIPECRAEAWFDVTVSSEFKKINHEEWQEDRGEYFWQAVSFVWAIPASKNKTENLSYGSHSGVECIPQFDEPKKSVKKKTTKKDMAGSVTIIQLTDLSDDQRNEIKEFFGDGFEDIIINVDALLESTGDCVIKVRETKSPPESKLIRFHLERTLGLNENQIKIISE